ncbi:MAG: hypothetical protein ABSE48_17825 [Verrucomicrobiota bacterium]
MDWLWIFGGLTVLAVVVVHLTVDGSSAVRASGLLPPNRGLPRPCPAVGPNRSQNLG